RSLTRSRSPTDRSLRRPGNGGPGADVDIGQGGPYWAWAPRPGISRARRASRAATLDVMSSYSDNGRGPDAWSHPWTHLRLDRRSPGYCRVTFEHPPINTLTAVTVAELAELVDLIEEDPDLNVVVFDSANPDFYLAHYDIENDPARTVALGVGPTGMHAWLDLLVRLSRAPVVSIASIRGRVRGAGSEFPPALADFFQMLALPRQQEQFARLQALGLNTDSDLERSLGGRVVESLPDA